MGTKKTVLVTDSYRTMLVHVAEKPRAGAAEKPIVATRRLERIREMLTIRDATLDDAGAIADIYNESIAAGDSTMHDELLGEERIRRQMLDFNERECFLIGEVDERIVGWGVIKRYSDRAGYRFCCETSVFLRRAEMRRGYGSTLKKSVIERCRQLGYHHLLARIFADNEASIEYNKKLGYELVGIQREIGFKNGRWQDVAVMQLVLDGSSTAPRS